MCGPGDPTGARFPLGGDLKGSSGCWGRLGHTSGGYILPGIDSCELEKAMATHPSTLAWKIPWMDALNLSQHQGLF